MKGQTMKKLLRFVCVALLTGAMVVACGDDEAVTTVVGPVVPIAPAPIFGSVGGTVSVEGSGLPGVSVNLVGAASQSATTGSSGGYSFGNVPAGTHGVQISGAPAEVAFVSTASVVTISTSGQTATADFSGNYIRTSSITGSVTAGGQGVVATVTASGAGMLMSVEAVVGSSDTDGDFTLSGLRAGTYHVAISDFGDIDFPVTTRDVTVGVGLSANVSFSAPGEGPVSTAFLVITGVTDTSDDDDTYSGRRDCHGRHRARRRTVREDHPVRGWCGGGQPVLRPRVLRPPRTLNSLLLSRSRSGCRSTRANTMRRQEPLLTRTATTP